jgi:hypothetical protein
VGGPTLVHLSDDSYNTYWVLADLRIGPLFIQGLESDSLQDTQELVQSQPQPDIKDDNQSHVRVEISTSVDSGYSSEQEPRPVSQSCELPYQSDENSFGDIMAMLHNLAIKSSREPLPDEHMRSDMPIPVRCCLAVAIEQEAEQPKDLVDDSRVLQNIPGPVREPLVAISTNLSAQPTQQHSLLKQCHILQPVSFDTYVPQPPGYLVPMPQFDKVDVYKTKHESPKTRRCISFKVSFRKAIPKYNPPWLDIVTANVLMQSQADRRISLSVITESECDVSL